MRTHSQQHSPHSRPDDVLPSQRARPPTARSTYDLRCPDGRVENGKKDNRKSWRDHDAYDEGEYDKYEVPYMSVCWSSGGETAEAGAQIRLCSSYHTRWKTNRKMESQDTPCPGCCGEGSGGEDGDVAVVLCPFMGTLVGAALGMFAGVDGACVDGASWGNGGRLARSSGAWTC